MNSCWTPIGSKIVLKHYHIFREMEADSKLSYILQNRDEHKSDLIKKLQIDSDLQRAAVGTLLERGDARSWGLLQQIRLVENQLAMLTNIELDKKKLQIDQNMVGIFLKF